MEELLKPTTPYKVGVSGLVFHCPVLFSQTCTLPLLTTRRIYIARLQSTHGGAHPGTRGVSGKREREREREREHLGLPADVGVIVRTARS